MKLGITGCGMIVHDLFNFIHDVDGVELEAMASIPAEYEKVQELAKANNVKKTYECYEDMLNDNEVDVIYLGVPNHLHYAMCKQALLSKGISVPLWKHFVLTGISSIRSRISSRQGLDWAKCVNLVSPITMSDQS